VRNLLLASLTLPTLLISGVASAATVEWRAGETAPAAEIVPMSPTQIDTITFTAAVGFGTYGNSCEANNWVGSPVISTNTAAREFIVEFTPRPFPPNFCPMVYLPVNGIEGELGQLDPGSWTLIITNVNWPLMNVTLPFTVTLASTASGELILHTVANDQTAGTQFPFDRPFFIARPLGARCNPGNGGETCGATTLQQGAPLKGTVPFNIGASAPSFSLPRYALNATATGSLPLYSPYKYISTYAYGIFNGTGVFSPGGGPGKRTFTVPGNGGPGARIAITPGAKQFGGTLGILGAIGTKRAHDYKNKTFVGRLGFFKTVLGRSCTGTGCLLPTTYPTATIYMKYRTIMGKATTVFMTPWGLPWTTGVVSITATAGPFPTLFRRTGYDHRTAKGLGTIQMVAPHLVRWEFANRSGPWDRHTGAIGILRIKFVPEPSGWVMFAVGMGILWMLYRWHGRRFRVRVG
jgi:hypothetical protein